jgi:hypothetical protein
MIEIGKAQPGRIDYGKLVAMMKKRIIGNSRLTTRYTSD